VTEFINVIVVVLNDRVGLWRTLNSIFDQNISNQNFRVIVVDGFSDDGSFELAKSMVGQAGQVFRSKPKGIYDAMNVGLAHVSQYSDHEGVIFLNAGDFFYSQRSLSILATELKDHAQVVGLSAFLELSYPYNVSVPNIVFSNIDSPVSMWLPHQSFCATIAVYKMVGLMNDRYRVAGDVDWFARAISQIGIPHHIPVIISVQVLGGTSRRYAYLGYQERRVIASNMGVRVDKYPLNLVFRIFLSQKFGIRLPRFLRRQIQEVHDHADEVVQRYKKVSKTLQT
jgi:glycosyltransferase involved in cell wall biosynthesis